MERVSGKDFSLLEANSNLVSKGNLSAEKAWAGRAPISLLL